MSPFDKARYERLLEGLEVTEVLCSEAMGGTETSRIDPEYFNRDAIVAQKKIGPGQSLGDLVLDGYRVVYETTQAIDREEGERLGLPYFLQAADISTPFIHAEGMICVPEADWIRYPKGRIKPGELLIEVKGKAEKVALVPDDFPQKTLVTGTCFKLTTKVQVDRYFLAAYLICRYGQALKDRLKSNLLVAYIAKDDLYGLPVPKVSDKLKQQLQRCFESIFSSQGEARSTLNVAERHLLVALGLDAWTPPEALSYVRSSRQAFAAGRLDAEFFAPRVEQLLARLGRDGLRLSDVAPARHERFEPSGSGDFEYIEIGSVGADGTAASESVPMAEAPSRATQYVRTGDVITSTVRPIRRLSALVAPEQDGAVCSSGFVVLQPQGISGEVLLTYLRLPLVCELMDLHTSATMYPAISESDLLALPIPAIAPSVQAQVQDAVRQSAYARQHATDLLDAAKRAVEIAIEDSEAVALRFLRDALPPLP
ncbi:MAG: hypothetical protein H5U28_04970 [Burkholderiaceae bacterium]|nr:hypothetical protein [Burkholderiaceae bacterium]